jgi:hypothetical protein
MKRSGERVRGLMKFGAFAMILSIHAAASTAGLHESTFSVSPDGTTVAFEVRDVSRREVVARLLQGKAIEVEWIDLSLADERINGVFKGKLDSVLQLLVAKINSVVVYDRHSDKTRISKIIFVGKPTAQLKSSEPVEIETGKAGAGRTEPPVAMAGQQGMQPILVPPSLADKAGPPMSASVPSSPPTPAHSVPPLVFPTATAMPAGLVPPALTESRRDR